MFMEGVLFIRDAMIEMAKPLFNFHLSFGGQPFSLGSLFIVFSLIAVIMSIFWRGGHK